MPITFLLNGDEVIAESEHDTTLLLVLRNQFGLSSPRYGCGSEQCGACRVLLDGEPSYACTMPLSDVAGRQVKTVEGLRDGETLHPIQAAFLDINAGQCGYCLSGILVSAVALLERNSDPSRYEIVAALDDHLCRCGSHNRIVRAIQQAAKVMNNG